MCLLWVPLLNHGQLPQAEQPTLPVRSNGSESGRTPSFKSKGPGIHSGRKVQFSADRMRPTSTSRSNSADPIQSVKATFHPLDYSSGDGDLSGVLEGDPAFYYLFFDHLRHAPHTTEPVHSTVVTPRLPEAPSFNGTDWLADQPERSGVLRYLWFEHEDKRLPREVAEPLVEATRKPPEVEPAAEPTPVDTLQPEKDPALKYLWFDHSP